MGKIYINENKILLQELIKVYQPVDYDWLSYKITKKNILTLHHIVKVEDGGELSFENSALLTKRTRQAFHICEHRDFVLYGEINDFFREIVSHSTVLDSNLEKQSREYKKALMKTLYK